MKVFQVLSGFCHWECTGLYPSVADIPPNTYAPDVLFVDAPDYVFEGWGYDYEAEGDARFIQPEAPEGWVYDPNTGTFYPEGGWPEDQPTETDLALEAMGVQVYAD